MLLSPGLQEAQAARPHGGPKQPGPTGNKLYDTGYHSTTRPVSAVRQSEPVQDSAELNESIATNVLA